VLVVLAVRVLAAAVALRTGRVCDGEPVDGALQVVLRLVLADFVAPLPAGAGRSVSRCGEAGRLGAPRTAQRASILRLPAGCSA